MTLPVLDPVPRAILFDLDDTLCDYSAARALRLRVAFSPDRDGSMVGEADRLRVDMVAASIAMHPHGTDHFPDLFRQFGIGDRAAATRAAAWYRGNRFHGLELFAGSREALQAVRSARSLPGFRRQVGIITNGPTEVQRAKIALLGLEELVDFVLISEEFGAAKPDPSIYHAALARMGVEPGEVAFVGDTAEYDMAGAHAAGIRTVWINAETSDWPGPGRAPDFTVAHIMDVPHLVDAVSLS
jgi:HAD superfamily hydrolase (TIGR01549 family)